MFNNLDSKHRSFHNGGTFENSCISDVVLCLYSVDGSDIPLPFYVKFSFIGAMLQFPMFTKLFLTTGEVIRVKESPKEILAQYHKATANF